MENGSLVGDKWALDISDPLDLANLAFVTKTLN